MGLRKIQVAGNLDAEGLERKAKDRSEVIAINFTIYIIIQ
jgi:hypothetical protein